MCCASWQAGGTLTRGSAWPQAACGSAGCRSSVPTVTQDGRWCSTWATAPGSRGRPWSGRGEPRLVPRDAVAADRYEFDAVLVQVRAHADGYEAYLRQ